MKTKDVDGLKFFATKGGFTLVEILLVIVILGILSGIAIPLYLGQRSKALHTEAKTNLEMIKLLMEQDYADKGCYYQEAGACKDKTFASAADIKANFPRFKPGDPAQLRFDYQLNITNNAQQFTATATGKNNSPVKDTTFTIDQDNNKNY